jgi:hypothetical protein
MSAPLAALLLHGDGLDELAMVAVGLVLAFLVISFTGRRSPDASTDEDDEAAVQVDETDRHGS